MGVRHNGINNYRSQGLYLPVPVYYHRAQVSFVDTESTFIYNTTRAWFNSMRAALQGKPVKAKLKTKGWQLYEGYNSKKRYVYKLFNPELGVEVYTYSVDAKKHSPIIFRIWGQPWAEQSGLAFQFFRAANEHAPGTNEIGPEPTIVEISRRWDKVTKNNWVQVDVFITGPVFEAEEALKWVFSLLHKEVLFTFDKITIPRIELFIRVHEIAERAVKDAMLALAEKWGENKTLIEIKQDLEPEQLFRLSPWAIWLFRVSDIRLSKNRIDLKLYRKKRFNYPAEHYTDHPKLEAAVYHVDYTPEAVARATKEALELIASVIEAANAYDAVIADPEHPRAGQALANPLLVSAINREDIKRRFAEFAPIQALELDDKERYILMQALDRKLTSGDLQQIAQALGVTVRTIQNKIKALVEKGLLIRFRTKRNQWVYLYNFDLIRPREMVTEPAPAVQQVLEQVAAEQPALLEALPADLAGKDRVFITYVLIRHGYRATKAIARILGVTDRQVRNYIKQLREAGLISVEKRGRHVFYNAHPVIQPQPVQGPGAQAGAEGEAQADEGQALVGPAEAGAVPGIPVPSPAGAAGGGGKWKRRR